MRGVAMKFQTMLTVGALGVAAVALSKLDDAPERQCRPIRLVCDSPLELLNGTPVAVYGNYGSFSLVVGECDGEIAYPEHSAKYAAAVAVASCRREACESPECGNWYDGAIVDKGVPRCVTSADGGKCICKQPGLKAMAVPDSERTLSLAETCGAEQASGDCIPRPCAELAGFPWRPE